ncbi:flavin reductase (DIM6/NTAB) family NADH-FMN oxidoreductase RutF [Curtobacterium sp. PhB25]|uniref:flavin reductase family protein n=1 Tax=unclassified Curtobacterium TaxID=257496 RepID=UPI00104EC4A3|nr:MULTISPECIES: flavin reductase family protein [unclassified Curtobacterium]TCU87668.1 flavin reductase (DIM6/NTAB) family NADH-FMN oxidoreductase RutF [Curtobacterium sp. PhB191]TDW72844.1 flavin reductase (DIM6/NTAB) family NADH-FMN oxidoreductase RutF [Curtobacterium sp. PhB25]
MYLDTSSEHVDFIWMIKNAVVPRPIAWIGSVSLAGGYNLAPYSYFQLVTMDPPMLMVSFTGSKDTLDNIRHTGDFVVNLVTEGFEADQTDTAALFDADVDEAALLGLDTTPSTVVTPPRLAGAKVALECRATEEKEMPGATLVFAEVVGVHTDDGVLDDRGRIDIERYRPVGRLGGALYTTITSAYRIPVPSADAVLAGHRSGVLAGAVADRTTGTPEPQAEISTSA